MINPFSVFPNCIGTECISTLTWFHLYKHGFGSSPRAAPSPPCIVLVRAKKFKMGPISCTKSSLHVPVCFFWCEPVDASSALHWSLERSISSLHPTQISHLINDTMSLSRWLVVEIYTGECSCCIFRFSTRKQMFLWTPLHYHLIRLLQPTDVSISWN